MSFYIQKQKKKSPSVNYLAHLTDLSISLEQCDNLLIASKCGSLESVAVAAALRVDVCPLADKISHRRYKPNEASIVEPGTSWRTWVIIPIPIRLIPVAPIRANESDRG